jgi:hypothetical protein
MALKPSDFIPKYPKGYKSGKGYLDEDGPPKGLRLGIIERIDEINMKADVKMLTGGGRRSEVDLTQGMCGPRSFWGGVPELNSVVIIGFREKHKQLVEAVILGFIPTGNRSGLRFDPFSPSDPNAIDPEDAAGYKELFGGVYRVKRLKLRPGDVGGMSADGSEMVLSKSLRMCNRAGDLFELRDEERTLVSQSIHRVDSASGVKHISGPVRREVFFLPHDVFADYTKRKLKDQPDYFGRDELQATGPGTEGASTRYANSAGTVLELFNNTTGEYPPITYSNGKTVFYPSTIAASTIEPKNPDDNPGEAFTEDRLELSHQTDLVQEVSVEIDGFNMNRRKAYIERVLGTVIGNDSDSSQGMRQYGKVLRPQLWTTGFSDGPGKFSLEECDRTPNDSDIESKTAAGAYLLRIFNPNGKEDNAPFALAIQKQGKVLLHVPKPDVERYPDAKGISVEANLLGALKMFLGSANPTNTSLFANLAGGIKAKIGHNTDTGNAVDITYGSPVYAKYEGVGDANGNGKKEEITGNYSLYTSGDISESVDGSRYSTASGIHSIQADRALVNAHSGYSLNAGELNILVSGKSQYNYAQAVIETIVTGGHLKTILAGGATETIAAGAKTVTVAAGATTFNNPAGAFAVNVGAGALSLTTASGALSLTAGAGAVSMSSGAAMSITAGAALAITAPVGCMITSTNIQLGGPTGVLGVCRGVPSLPPGTPTLDFVTGLPLLGSAMVRSI